MIHLFSALNWMGILAAFAGYFFLGPLWYMFLFKKQYARSLGRENQPQSKQAAIYIVGPAVCSLIITITSALFMHALEINSYTAALEFAFVAGLGYLVTNTINIAINPNIPRPMLYGAVSGAFHLVGIVVACTVLYAMK
jgi:hypothetical protein